ncbi:MAG TPA: 3D domain-containing protein [Vicinamibacterales bacterium]|nr:3D domain-containing protein [Vicinamibacterales bacterium]
MKRILSRSNSHRLVVMVVVIGGLLLTYEATTFDLLPWGSITRVVDPSAPVPGARLDFSATAYCKGTTTASGAQVRTGIAAADDSILPVGSVVNVASDNMRYNGVYTIMDTGPRVQGRLLDLYMWSCKEALAFGRKPIQVTVLRLGWNPQASTPGLIDRLFRRRERARAEVPPPAGPPPVAIEPPIEETAGDEGAEAPPSPVLSEPPTSSADPSASRASVP